ncbi:MAG: response regulator, partial [Xanthobacteraceae bacterium]
MSVSPDVAVLVVDDVPENRDLLVRRLKRLGINEVEQAANGLEALAAIERRNFDLVLLDIMMPEL